MDLMQCAWKPWTRHSYNKGFCLSQTWTMRFWANIEARVRKKRVPLLSLTSLRLGPPDSQCSGWYGNLHFLTPQSLHIGCIKKLSIFFVLDLGANGVVFIDVERTTLCRWKALCAKLSTDRAQCVSITRIGSSALTTVHLRNDLPLHPAELPDLLAALPSIVTGFWRLACHPLLEIVAMFNCGNSVDVSESMTILNATYLTPISPIASTCSPSAQQHRN